MVSATVAVAVAVTEESPTAVPWLCVRRDGLVNGHAWELTTMESDDKVYWRLVDGIDLEHGVWLRLLALASTA